MTDALMMQQIHGAMNVFVERSRVVGTASLGPLIQVKERSAANLLFGGKPQAGQFDPRRWPGQGRGRDGNAVRQHGDEFVRVDQRSSATASASSAPRSIRTAGRMAAALARRTMGKSISSASSHSPATSRSATTRAK